MSKTNLKIATLSIFFGISVVSCKKQEPINPNLSQMEVPAQLPTGWPNLWDLEYWHDNGNQPGLDGEDFGCWDTPGSCLPSFTISGAAPQVINNLVTDIEADNQEAIRQLFSDYIELFDDIIEPQSLNNLIEGVYTLSYRGENVPGSKIYLIVRDGENQIANVYPLQL